MLRRGLAILIKPMKKHLCLFTLTLIVLLSLATALPGEPNSPLSPEDCVKIALGVHPEVKLAAQRVEEAQQKIRQARSLKGPQVDFDTSWTNYKWLPPNKQKIIGGGTTDVYSEVALRQLLYSGGRTQALLEQSRLDLLAAQEELRRTRQTVAFQVTQAFFSLRQAEELLRAQQEGVNQVQAYLEIAQKRFAVGAAKEIDVMKAEVQLADVQQARIAAENKVTTARMTLNVAMGRTADTPLEITDSVPPQATEAPKVSLAEALLSHPEWIRSELAIRGAEAGLTVAKSLAMPDLGLEAAYNLEGGSFPPDIDNWNIGLRLSVPLFDSGNAAGAKGAARSRIEQTRSVQERLRQRLELAVQEAQVAVRDAQERMRVTALSADEARRTLAVEQERYRVGAGSSIEVIDAQVALTRAETNAIRAIYDYRIALAQLEYALGHDPALAGEHKLPLRAAGGQ
jgi:outer membrane protein